MRLAHPLAFTFTAATQAVSGFSYPGCFQTLILLLASWICVGYWNIVEHTGNVGQLILHPRGLELRNITIMD